MVWSNFAVRHKHRGNGQNRSGWDCFSRATLPAVLAATKPDTYTHLVVTA